MKTWLYKLLLLVSVCSVSLSGIAFAELADTAAATQSDSISIVVDEEQSSRLDQTSEVSQANTYFQAALAMASSVVDAVWEEDASQDSADIKEADEHRTGAQADPFEKYNRMMFRFNSQLDEVALRPLAENYREHTPALVRQGISNFFSNIGDVGVIANSALQGKLEQAMWDTSRLTINTVAGLGGVIDVATMLDIEKNTEDFGQTFGVWGIPEGPYIVLPVLGPRTMRSAVGTAIDTYIQVETLGAVSDLASGPDLVSEMLALNIVNQREKMLAKSSLLDEAALDPYVFTREAYLAYRRCQVEDCDKIDYVAAAPEIEAPISDGENSLDEIDQLDEIDRLDDIDMVDEIDRLDELD